MAKPYKRQDSAYWWISPRINGVSCPQSSKTTDYQEAAAELRRLEGKITEGLITPASMKTLFSDLAVDLERDYRIKERRSIKDLQRRLKLHILPVLGELKANAINSATIAEYIEGRQQKGAKPGGINRELAAIKRAYTLGRKSGKTLATPAIEMLPEDNERETAFSDEQFAGLHAQANKILQSVLTVAYWTGWRKTSIIKMEWSQVDFEGGWIRLKSIDTKNRKATKFPLVPDLMALFKQLKAETEAIQKANGAIVLAVFHRDGEPVRSIRKAFESARRRAGLPGYRLHDFRRTAVRALASLGYDYKTIMDCCGFKTLAMVIRYMGPTPDERIREVGERLQAKRQGKTS